MMLFIFESSMARISESLCWIETYLCMFEFEAIGVILYLEVLGNTLSCICSGLGCASWHEQLNRINRRQQLQQLQ